LAPHVPTEASSCQLVASPRGEDFGSLLRDLAVSKEQFWLGIFSSSAISACFKRRCVASAAHTRNESWLSTLPLVSFDLCSVPISSEETETAPPEGGLSACFTTRMFRLVPGLLQASSAAILCCPPRFGYFGFRRPSGPQRSHTLRVDLLRLPLSLLSGGVLAPCRTVCLQTRPNDWSPKEEDFEAARCFGWWTLALLVSHASIDIDVKGGRSPARTPST